MLEVNSYAAGQNWATVADRASGRWSNRLAALVVNAVRPYRTGDVAAAVVPESRVMLAPTAGGGSSLRVNPVEAN